MKKLAFLLLFVLFSGIVYQLDAQPQYRPNNPGVLRVRLADNYPITLALDGRYFEKHGTRLTIGDLPPGRHYIKIYTYTATGNGKSRAHLVYEGKIKVLANDVTNLIYNSTTGDIHLFAGNDDDYNEPEENVMRNRKMEPDMAAGNTTSTPAAPDTMRKVIPADVTKPNLPAITADALNKAGIKINKLVTDTDKLKELQSIMLKKAFTTNQLQLMLTWLSFETSRVEFAKWAFEHTLDKENYSQIAEHFKYQDSKDELIQFLQSRK